MPYDYDQWMNSPPIRSINCNQVCLVSALDSACRSFDGGIPMNQFRNMGFDDMIPQVLPVLSQGHQRHFSQNSVIGLCGSTFSKLMLLRHKELICLGLKQINSSRPRCQHPGTLTPQLQIRTTTARLIQRVHPVVMALHMWTWPSKGFSL